MARSPAPQRSDETDDEYAKRLRQNEYHRTYVSEHTQEIALYQSAYHATYRTNPENQARQREAGRRFRKKRAEQAAADQQS